LKEKIIVPIDPDIADLVPGFLANRRKDVERLRALVQQGDYAAIKLIGHSMKGAGGGYGFDPITDYGAAIERAAQTGDGATVLAQTDLLDEYLQAVEPVAE
jgi:hypothetical protein